MKIAQPSDAANALRSSLILDVDMDVEKSTGKMIPLESIPFDSLILSTHSRQETKCWVAGCH